MIYILRTRVSSSSNTFKASNVHHLWATFKYKTVLKIGENGGGLYYISRTVLNMIWFACSLRFYSFYKKFVPGGTLFSTSVWRWTVSFSHTCVVCLLCSKITKRNLLLWFGNEIVKRKYNLFKKASHRNVSCKRWSYHKYQPSEIRWQ